MGRPNARRHPIYKLRCYLDVDWCAPGAAPGVFGSLEANNPGIGAALAAGSVGIAQTLRIQQAEQVLTTTSTSAITQAQFNAAVAQLATDLQAAFAAVNSTGQTNLAQAQGWATGQP